MRNKKLPGLFPALLSGLLLNLIFPRWDLDFLAWVALVPLFRSLAESPSRRNSFLLGLACGMVYFTGSCFWITNTMVRYGHLPWAASVLILFLLTLYMALYVAVFSLFFHYCRQKAGIFRALTLSPFLWSFLEYCRTFLLSGFPWNFLGASQFRNLPVIQFADLTGVYGISFLVCLVNAFLFFLFWNYAGSRGGRGTRVYLGGTFTAFCVAVPLILVSVLFYGRVKIAQFTDLPHRDALKVCLVQGNIAQDQKWDPLRREHIMRTYANLTAKAARHDADLVVWPETALPFFFNRERSKVREIKALASRAGVFLLTGSPSMENRHGERRLRNSAYFISDRGAVLGRYDKVKLVPFGEYVPLEPWLWFVGKMVAGIGNFFPGKGPKIMPLPGGPFGVLICFEIIFPGLARWNVREGARFLVNITNDAWFGRSAGPYQHLSSAVFRAIENRVPVVRAANTGISAIINRKGRIESSSGLFVRQVVKGGILPAGGPHSFYTRYGDIFSWLCGLVLGSTLMAIRGLSSPD